MKILFVTPSYTPADQYGGPPEVIHEWATALAETGKVDIRVLTTNANGSRTLQVPREIHPRNGIRVEYCPRLGSGSVSFGLLAALPRMVAWADIVHLFAVYSFPTLPTLLTCRLRRRPVLWSPLGALMRSAYTRRRLAKCLWEFSCRIVAGSALASFHATSLPEAQAVSRRMPIGAIHVIPHGVVVPASEPPRAEHKELRILYLGRLHPIKGVESLIKACVLLGDVPWRLTVAGSGQSDYVKRLVELSQESPGAERVAFIGSVSKQEIHRLFCDADVVVAPSAQENFCLVVAEALAHSVPVITSTNTPWDGLATHGCGLCVDSDPQSIANALMSMLRADLRVMGERGRKWMLSDFSWDGVVSASVATYESIAAKYLGAESNGRVRNASDFDIQ